MALDAVDVDLFAGEVHAILGENGAGKSTLVGILSGNLLADGGHVLLNGSDVAFRSAQDARSAGIDIVHQHFMLVPAFTIAENLALVSADSAGAEAMGWQFDPKAKTGSLSVGEQQRVEIAKALSGNKRIVLFDEPTASLTPDDVEDLFRVMVRLKASGIAIVLIAHKLREALAVADRITVLRRGKVVATMLRSEATEELLAELMVGDVPPGLTRTTTGLGEVLVSAQLVTVRDDRGVDTVKGVSIDTRAGEIVGIGGVDGNGQIELAEVLAGVRKAQAGTVTWKDGDVPAYIPQDRRRDGLALQMTVEENLLITGHQFPSLRSWVFFAMRKVREWCNELIERFEIKVGGPEQVVEALSGGNQQKIVVARTLSWEPKVIVAVNPTRGLDIRAENYVHSQLLAAKARGAAVVLFSTDLDELAKIADRTMFMSGGQLLSGGDVGKMMGGIS